MKRAVLSAFVVLIVCVHALFAGGVGEETGEDRFRIGVFVPGVVDGSPTYEMMVNGVERAAEEAEDASVAVIEGGFNQATWEEGVMSMAASGSYDLIVTSNPSMPEIVAEVAAAVPDVLFLVLDGYLAGNPRVHTILFNQQEQAFSSGYFAGLVTAGGLPGANGERIVGLLAGQEYPIMNEVIRPAYELGVRSVLAGAEVDFRVLGNWFDAGRAQEIAADMIDRGADVILTIAGGGNQGVIAASRERGTYVLWYDESGYDRAPGVVVGSTFVRQDEAAYRATRDAIAGTLPYGEAVVLGVADGMVSFDTDHPAFVEAVPEPIRAEMESLLRRMETGELVLEMPLPAGR
ncbi:MAG: BMP family ABC transporter substrate-binding protein [Spirochaetales bacterium]|nr:BMP family ABC transporter substrate-binding protein [Spirochaetales bacterium]